MWDGLPSVVHVRHGHQYHLAWVSVFDDSPRKLVCTWHVDRAWRGALQQHVKGVEKQAAVYSQLRVLLEELAVDKFITLVGKVRTYNNTTVYTQGAGINTNMFVEAFHNTMKQVYMQG